MAASMISSAVTSATKAAHSAVVSLASATQITPGSPVPNVSVKVNSPTETLNFSTLPGKNVVVVVPAAFSPSCSEIQVPEYIGRFKEFEAKGVKGVYVVSVNDIFVMKAWKKDLVAKAEGGDSQVVFVADDTASFASATGLVFDASSLLGGPRAKRAAIVIEDGKVLHIAVEDEPPQVTVSSADSVLKAL